MTSIAELLDRDAVELLPCPFCGNVAKLFFDPDRGHVVGCVQCRAYVCRDRSEGAIAAWNRRAPLSAREATEGEPTAQVEALARWFNALPDGGMGKEHFDALLAIVRSASIPPSGVAVKPLEWEIEHVGGGLRAGEYRVRSGLWTHGYYWIRSEGEPHTGYVDEDAAKAAAQADYEARIRSVLVPSPSGVAEARAEALEEAAGWHEQQIATLRAKGETMDAATRGMPRGQLRTIDAVLLHAKSAAAIRNLILAACPICAVPFKPDDMCLPDINEGTCHAECLEDSPMVDLETGEPLPEGSPAPVPYRYDSLFPTLSKEAE